MPRSKLRSSRRWRSGSGGRFCCGWCFRSAHDSELAQEVTRRLRLVVLSPASGISIEVGSFIHIESRRIPVCVVLENHAGRAGNLSAGKVRGAAGDVRVVLRITSDECPSMGPYWEHWKPVQCEEYAEPPHIDEFRSIRRNVRVNLKLTIWDTTSRLTVGEVPTLIYVELYSKGPSEKEVCDLLLFNRPGPMVGYCLFSWDHVMDRQASSPNGFHSFCQTWYPCLS